MYFSGLHHIRAGLTHSHFLHTPENDIPTGKISEQMAKRIPAAPAAAVTRPVDHCFYFVQANHIALTRINSSAFRAVSMIFTCSVQKNYKFEIHWVYTTYNSRLNPPFYVYTG